VLAWLVKCSCDEQGRRKKGRRGAGEWLSGLPEGVERGENTYFGHLIRGEREASLP
jgi:hypothetical protein